MEATNRLDFDAAMRPFAPDAVFDVSAAGVGRFEGRQAVRGYLEDWLGAYEEQRFADWEGRDLGGGVVFVVATLHARMRASAAAISERWTFTIVWRGRAIASVHARADVDQALRDAEALARSGS